MSEHGRVTSTEPRNAAPAPPAVRLSRLQLAVAGILTGLAGLAVGQATTAILRQRLSPPFAVAEAVIEATPGKLALDLVHFFGRYDKPLLTGGVIVAMVLLSALAGLRTRASLMQGYLIFLAMAAVAGLAELTRPETSAVGILPVALGGITWIALLPVLVADPVKGTPPLQARREFLVRAGVVGLGALVVGAGGRFFGHKRRVVEDARAALKLPVTRGTVPAGAEVGLDKISPWRVPNGDFYRIDTTMVTPTVAIADWSLRIHGMVDREITLSYEDLVKRQLTEAWVTLCCVSNEVGGDLIGNAWWSGVRVADLLAEAGVQDGADAVLQTSVDGWTCGTPLGALTDDRNALLAVAMNGDPLPIEHGFPVRMVVPGLYGFVSATKWVVDLKVTRYDDFSAFWTQRGWSAYGPVRTQSKIEVPQANHRVMAGDVRVGGVAWAQHTGIAKVEVRLDGGPWTEVDTLGAVPDDDTWVQWSGTVKAGPGVHTLAVRATDKSGYTQTGVKRDVVPDGATGWHTVEFTAE